jgi:hypothetical protein
MRSEFDTILSFLELEPMFSRDYDGVSGILWNQMSMRDCAVPRDNEHFVQLICTALLHSIQENS